MKQLKKTILTLVALLALTAGAWADGIVCTASDLGKVLCTDGSIYENVSAATTAGKTAAAVIAYVDETNKNGLAIALSDEVDMNWSTAKSTCEGKTAVSGAAWLLPSVEQWRAMFKAFGGNERSYTGLNTAITTAGGTALQEDAYYWSSTDLGGDYAYNVNLVEGSADWYEEQKPNFFLVRACLAFDIAAASSGPEVDWNKAEKTGQFTMPGGNVELEPEYYPQAALTAVPTAINDVPATTDGAIVNAGTVANIDGTTTAQGTVMYYAVQSATAPTAPDYDDTGWTDKVPTAADFKEGNVYVWYYVKGADGDETSTFNDGAITKLGESGYITLLAAPTYAVTFADGVNPEPPAEPEWTASPNADVTKGDKVTVTYTGAKKVLGVKAEKKAAAVPKAAKDATAEDVGKLIGADGNIYDDAGAATAANTTAVAKICYVGSDNGEDAPYNHGLALAMSDANGGSKCMWKTSNTDAGHTKQTSSTFTVESGLQYNDATHNSDTYPAFKAAIANNGTAAPTGCSAWFLASGYQWKQMIGAAGLSNLGLQEYAYYWSSAENDALHAWDFYTGNGIWDGDLKDGEDRVRSCLAF